jgi:hypothetical protein
MPPETHLGPAVTGSDPVGVREGDLATPPLTDDNRLTMAHSPSSERCPSVSYHATAPLHRPLVFFAAHSLIQVEKRVGRVRNALGLLHRGTLMTVHRRWTTLNVLGWIRPMWVSDVAAQAFDPF